MNSYIDYNYYNQTFKGNLIPQEIFDMYANKASNKVRNRIFNRNITGFESKIKNVTCSIADILYNQFLNQEKLNNILKGKEKQITSEKVGDYSVNISNTSIEDLKKVVSNEYVGNLISNELEETLFLTGLLNCGGIYVR